MNKPTTGPPRVISMVFSQKWSPRAKSDNPFPVGKTMSGPLSLRGKTFLTIGDYVFTACCIFKIVPSCIKNLPDNWETTQRVSVLLTEDAKAETSCVMDDSDLDVSQYKLGDGNTHPAGNINREEWMECWIIFSCSSALVLYVLKPATRSINWIHELFASLDGQANAALQQKEQIWVTHAETRVKLYMPCTISQQKPLGHGT